MRVRSKLEITDVYHYFHIYYYCRWNNHRDNNLPYYYVSTINMSFLFPN